MNELIILWIVGTAFLILCLPGILYAIGCSIADWFSRMAERRELRCVFHTEW